MNGILIVDKPAGCTSHDVVQRVRKALRQRSVGHAGTLDPLATGVLVVAIGEATKLVSHLQADDKRYEVTIALGVETDSLDADGEITRTLAVPPLDRAKVEQALRGFIGRYPQEAQSSARSSLAARLFTAEFGEVKMSRPRSGKWSCTKRRSRRSAGMRFA